MMHRQPGMIEHTPGVECELVNHFHGERYAPHLSDAPDIDFGVADTMVVVFVRGAEGRLQQLVWPMRLSGPAEPLH